MSARVIPTIEVTKGTCPRCKKDGFLTPRGICMSCISAELDSERPARKGHNSGGIAADRLRSYIERIERLEEEKKGLSDDILVVFAEAKSAGFDTKIMRQIVRERKMNAVDRQEREALLDVYRNALGMLADTPLGQVAMQRAAQ